jgi:hypothetical protein
MRRAAASVAVAAVACLAAACRPPLMKLPSGTATSVAPADAAAALAQATNGCAAVRTLTAEIAVSGSAGGRRLRGRLLGGVAAPASVRLEAVAPFGQPLFIFVAVGDEATLLLPRDERVLEEGRPDAVLEAIAGVPLGAVDLETTLTGCALPGAPPAADARQYGDAWIVIGEADSDELYLRRSASTGPWQLVATTRRAAAPGRRWRADYADRQAEVPRTIRVTSVDAEGGSGQAFDLRLTLSQVEINAPLDPEVFTVRIPPTAAPIRLDELRASGPLAPK